MMLVTKVAQFPKQIIERSRGSQAMGFQSPPRTLKAFTFLYFNTRVQAMEQNSIVSLLFLCINV